jgi:hypothetical protein
MKNTYIIHNSFTGYRAEITPKGDLPSVATVRKHMRASRASDCKSGCTITDAQTGEPLALVDRGQGEELVRMA